jgi:hypothetical protein
MPTRSDGGAVAGANGDVAGGGGEATARWAVPTGTPYLARGS